jgi:hypothetical protein
MEGHTWLWTGERLGLGFYRAGNFTVVFLLKTGSAGLQLIRWRSPPQWQGRIVEADCVFDERHALLTVLVEKDGQRLGYLWLLGADGQVLANAEGTGRMFARARGKALLRGHAVCSTDEGLLSLKVESGRLIEGTLFTDCEPFVSAGDELVPQADGALFVIGARDITQLSLH